jgi:HSP20 family molecular chaperone IbpA
LSRNVRTFEEKAIMNQTESNAVTKSNGHPAGVAQRPRRVVAPDVDVYESADELLVVGDLPGVSGENIEVRVENDTLTLEGKHASPLGTAPAVAREYEEVDYARSFRIPAGIDAAAVRAEAKNGAVLVHLPKAAGAKPRKIAVRAA